MNYFYKTFLVCLSVLYCSCALNCAPYHDELATQFNSDHNKKQLPYQKYIEQLKCAIKDEYIQRSNGINKNVEFNLGGWSKVAEKGSLKALPCYKEQPNQTNNDKYQEIVKKNESNLKNNVNYFTYNGRVFITDSKGRISREATCSEPSVEETN